MDGDAKVKQQFDDDKIIVEVDGSINENFKISIDGFDNVKTVDFNLDKVKMMNSSGVKNWFNFIHSIPDAIKLNYKNVPPVIIMQMNLVEGFLTKNTTVESFYAPYYDESNDCEVFKLLVTSELQGLNAPTFKNEDGEDLEFDAIEEVYFKFLEKLK
ncbi:MAG: hypothetical protein H6621_08875 [Halobacteriovoraceae bacterium]|nr:hypothetical protein [Halobacteriovoraceae bacterium]MCB9095166.1 hypothetical protein [Halobacteriovoraceae bacterium]